MNIKQLRATGFAILAAALYALNAPFSKLLLTGIEPTMLAALLYLGAGLGVGAMRLFSRRTDEKPLSRRDLPYTVGMIVLDIAAPVCLMLGLARTTSANAALLNNFEIAATSVIALVLFREAVSRRLWCAIALVTAASILLSIEDSSSFAFSTGSLLVLLAYVCWGFENNCTRMLSTKNPLEIVIVKGFGSGLGSLALALCVGEALPAPGRVLPALLLGFVAYGLSIFFYIRAQRALGAAKTSAYYAAAPFIGVALSLLIFRQRPSGLFLLALAVMLAGAYLAAMDTI